MFFVCANAREGIRCNIAIHKKEEFGLVPRFCSLVQGQANDEELEVRYCELMFQVQIMNEVEVLRTDVLRVHVQVRYCEPTCCKSKFR